VRDERGTATILAVSLASVLMLLGLAAAWVGAVVAEHRAAQSAADLAALAGAQAIQAGQSPCVAVGHVARANAAQATRCSVVGADVWVTVQVHAPALLGRSPTVTGRAHAGPGP
jgi:secretion/DNA translocation related TadE-like protein